MEKINTELVAQIQSIDGDKSVKPANKPVAIVKAFIDSTGLMGYASDPQRDKFVREATLFLNKHIDKIKLEKAMDQLPKLLIQLLNDSQEGISLDPNMHHIYLDVRKDWKSGTSTIDRQYEYRGKIIKMNNAGWALVDNDIIYKDDEYKVIKGSAPQLLHIKKLGANYQQPTVAYSMVKEMSKSGKAYDKLQWDGLNMGDAIAVYAVAKHLQTGQSIFKVLEHADLFAALSKATNHTIWVADTPSMLRKTAINRLFNIVPGLAQPSETYADIPDRATLPEPATWSIGTSQAPPIADQVLEVLAANGLDHYYTPAIVDLVVDDGEIDAEKLYNTVIPELKQKEKGNAE